MYTVVSNGNYAQKVLYLESALSCYFEFTRNGDQVCVYDENHKLIVGREN